MQSSNAVKASDTNKKSSNLQKLNDKINLFKNLQKDEIFYKPELSTQKEIEENLNEKIKELFNLEKELEIENHLEAKELLVLILD